MKQTTKKTTTAPWTKAHRDEAWACMCDIAKRRGFEVDPARAALPTPWQRSCETEKDFRAWLASGATGLDANGIRVAVRRVRALAEGRLVRETKTENRIRCAECQDSGWVDDEEEGECPTCDQSIPVTCGKCLGKATVTFHITRIRKAAR